MILLPIAINLVSKAIIKQHFNKTLSLNYAIYIVISYTYLPIQINIELTTTVWRFEKHYLVEFQFVGRVSRARADITL